MTTRIVVGVDGSEHGRRALQTAIEEARRRGGDVTVEAVLAYQPVPLQPGMAFGYVPTIDPARMEAEATAAVLAAVDEVDTGDVPVDPIAASGSPSRVLVTQAKGADLLVVGSRGHGELGGLLLGSTSLYAVTHAPCPVLVVRPTS